MTYNVEWFPSLNDRPYIFELIRECLGPVRANEADMEMFGGEHTSTIFCFIRDCGHIVACAAVGTAPFYAKTWWLGFSAVASEYRNRGMADALIQARLRYIKENGGSTVFAAAVGDGHRLLRHGFEVVKPLSDTHTLLMANLNAGSN